jgi:hypothetical protein
MTPQPAAVSPRRLVWARALRRWRDAQTWHLASRLILFALALTHVVGVALRARADTLAVHIVRDRAAVEAMDDSATTVSA